MTVSPVRGISMDALIASLDHKICGGMEYQGNRGPIHYTVQDMESNLFVRIYDNAVSALAVISDQRGDISSFLFDPSGFDAKHVALQLLFAAKSAMSKRGYLPLCCDYCKSIKVASVNCANCINCGAA